MSAVAIADMVLERAVAKVRERCAAAVRQPYDPEELHPLTQAHAGSLQVLQAAAESAELILKAGPRPVTYVKTQNLVQKLVRQETATLVLDNEMGRFDLPRQRGES